MAIKGQSFLKAALLIAASAGLSGCVYDVGLGFASDGYYDDAYGCDPYGGYDAYYNCDYGQAFSNIGFGGGWYDNYYYPGHGIFLFDTFGRRYPMREQYRRYWGERRHSWYREHRGRDWERSRFDDRDRGYKGNARPERSASPDRQGGWTRDRDDDRRGDGRHNRSGEQHDSNAPATPNPHYLGGRRDRGRSDVPSRGRGIEDGVSPALVVPANEHTADIDRRRKIGGERIPHSQPARQTNSTQSNVPPELSARSTEAPRTQPLRSRASEGGTERPD